MKCNEFVKLIPDILNNDIEEDKLGEIIEHINNAYLEWENTISIGVKASAQIISLFTFQITIQKK